MKTSSFTALAIVLGFASACFGCASETAEPGADLTESGDDIKGGGVVTLAKTTGEMRPSLVSDGTYVYWMTEQSIWRVPAAGNAPAVKLLANLRDMYAGGPVAPYGPGKVVIPMDNDLRLVTTDPKDASKWKNVSLGKLALDSNQAWLQNVRFHDGRVYFVQEIGTKSDVFRVKLDGTELENISAHKGSTYLDTIHGVAVTSAGVFWTGYAPGVAFKPHGSDHEVRIPAEHRSVNAIVASGSSVFWIDSKKVWIGSVDLQTTETKARVLVDSTVNPPDTRAIAVDAKRAYWISGGNLVSTKWPSGTDPIVLAKDQKDVLEITVDGQNVYWTVAMSEKEGVLRAVKKPQ